MTYLQRQISQNRRRLVEGDFDLDLSYITPRVIAMGYPATGLEALYRNSYTDVKRFLDSHHGNNYFVFNLCKEKNHQYDPRLFDFRVFSYPFSDHNPPSLRLICSFVQHAAQIMSSNPNSVIVVHCKAGKGRTGIMCGCLMAYYSILSGDNQTVEQIIQKYTDMRFTNGKGLTIPSQNRYIRFFYGLMRNNFDAKLKQVPVWRLNLPAKTLQKIETNFQTGKITIVSNRKFHFVTQNTIHRCRFDEEQEEVVTEIEQFENINLQVSGEYIIRVEGQLNIYGWIGDFQVRYDSSDIDWEGKKEVQGKWFQLSFV